MKATRPHVILSATIGLLISSAFAQDREKVANPEVAPAPAPAPAAAAPAPAPATTVHRSNAPFGYYSTAGRIYRIENGRATPVQTEQTMRISPKGITGFDGRSLTIPEGQMIGADGRLAPLPKGITGLPAAGATIGGTALSIDQGKAAPNNPGANSTLTLDAPTGAGTTGTKAPDIGVVPNPPLPTATAAPAPAGTAEPTPETTNEPAGKNTGTTGGTTGNGGETTGGGPSGAPAGSGGSPTGSAGGAKQK
jgi:hypothetical protein